MNGDKNNNKKDTQNHLIKAEFHIHTSKSHDSVMGKYALLFMCYFKKINLIAITDHNEISGAVKYKNFFEKRGIDVIVGEEIMTTDGEIIGLFLNEKIEPFLSAEKTIELIKKQNGLVYVPHPYDEKRYKTVLKYEKIVENKNDIDFIEIHNGRNIKDEFSNEQEKIQKELNIIPIIGSDAHTLFEVGRNCVYLEIEDSKKMKQLLKKSIQKSTFQKRKCLKFTHNLTKIARLINFMKEGKYNEIYRIINGRFKKNK